MEIDWKEVGYVAGAGAAGGALSWIYAEAVGTPIGLGWLGSPLASICLGMGAGVLGVYLVAKTDMKAALHGLVFAMACGFAWRPVLEATSALVDARIEEQREQTIAAETNVALDSSQEITVRSRDVEALDRSVVATVEALRVPVRDLGTMETRSARLEEVVANISRAEGFSVEERIASLVEIGNTAAAAGDQNIAFRSMQAITWLSKEDTAEADTRERAAAAVEEIGDRGALRHMPTLQLNSNLLGASIREDEEDFVRLIPKLEPVDRPFRRQF